MVFVPSPKPHSRQVCPCLGPNQHGSCVDTHPWRIFRIEDMAEKEMQHNTTARRMVLETDPVTRTKVPALCQSPSRILHRGGGALGLLPAIRQAHARSLNEGVHSPSASLAAMSWCRRQTQLDLSSRRNHTLTRLSHWWSSCMVDRTSLSLLACTLYSMTIYP
ncbi:hypothetical protein LY78DRAFT_217969 [Colletotrichum sublineola]|nr:hypothetical protein LY78DRAFT_217969 [Colletotrichum sublineola]